jgi:hypothetical protein
VRAVLLHDEPRFAAPAVDALGEGYDVAPFDW